MEDAGLRRSFVLPPEDVEFLDASGLAWEALIEGNLRWVLLRKFPIPQGYNVSESDIAIQLSDSYPSTQLDMVYVFPALSLSSGVPIKATDVSQPLDGQSYQRWSRHRTPANPWRPNIDYLGTHIGLIEEWLLKEVKK
jgi:hypothetical protein